ncbi:MAG: hypothetical protein ABI266_10410, partial [Ginsengibacter sp.]
PGADTFYTNLRKILGPVFNKTTKKIPVLKTIASTGVGISSLYAMIKDWNFDEISTNKIELMAQKVLALVQYQRMKTFDKGKMKKDLEAEIEKEDFNLYLFAKKYE